jgi:hypothetical protein
MRFQHREPSGQSPILGSEFMSTRNSRDELFAGAIIIPLLIMQRPTDDAGTTAVLFGAIITRGFVSLATHFWWTPTLDKAGFWRSSHFLGEQSWRWGSRVAQSA